MNPNIHPHSSWQAAGVAIVLFAFVPAAIYSVVRWWIEPAIDRACRGIGR